MCILRISRMVVDTNGQRHGNLFLKTEDGERRESFVCLEQLSDIPDDDLAVDELKTVERRKAARRVLDLEEFTLEGIVDDALDLYIVLEQVVDS